jgi:catabolite regulation protein CreA
MENTPMDTKLSLFRRIFDPNQKNFRSLITSVDMMEWAKKTSHATVPLNDIRVDDAVSR